MPAEINDCFFIYFFLNLGAKATTETSTLNVQSLLLKKSVRIPVALKLKTLWSRFAPLCPLVGQFVT